MITINIRRHEILSLSLFQVNNRIVRILARWNINIHANMQVSFVKSENISMAMARQQNFMNSFLILLPCNRFMADLLPKRWQFLHEIFRHR